MFFVLICRRVIIFLFILQFFQPPPFLFFLPPSIGQVWQGSSPGSLYTILMVDEGIERLGPAQYFHWAVENVPSTGEWWRGQEVQSITNYGDFAHWVDIAY